MSYRLKGWLIVWAVIAAVEAKAPHGHTLSEGCDVALERKWGRVLVPLGVIQVSAHLLNIIPPRYDLIHQGFQLLRSHVKPADNGFMDCEAEA